MSLVKEHPYVLKVLWLHATLLFSQLGNGNAARSRNTISRLQAHLEAVDEYVVEDDVVEVDALDVARLQLERHLIHVLGHGQVGHQVVVGQHKVLDKSDTVTQLNSG